MVKHILIVDDQHEVRRMLRAGIETLGPEFQVTDLPSAEESLVVLSIQPVDLLITDIGLPGMSGLQLLEKIRKRNHGLKLILITGLPDPNLRQQVAEADAEAYFIKPIQMAAFLQAVQAAVSGRDISSTTALSLMETSLPARTMPECLAGLRIELGAEATFLLNEWGEILAQAGELPVGEAESLLIPSLLSAISAGARLSVSLGNKIPENLLLVKGSQYRLCAINAGPAHVLLVLLKSDTDFPTHVAGTLYTAVQEIISLLKVTTSPAIVSQQLPTPPQKDIEIPPLETEKLEEILSVDSTGKITPNNLDQFWENLAEDGPLGGSSNASVITYEQARKLGLTPEEP